MWSHRWLIFWWGGEQISSTGHPVRWFDRFLLLFYQVVKIKLWVWISAYYCCDELVYWYLLWVREPLSAKPSNNQSKKYLSCQLPNELATFSTQSNKRSLGNFNNKHSISQRSQYKIIRYRDPIGCKKNNKTSISASWRNWGRRRARSSSVLHSYKALKENSKKTLISKRSWGIEIIAPWDPSPNSPKRMPSNFGS